MRNLVCVKRTSYFGIRDGALPGLRLRAPRLVGADAAGVRRVQMDDAGAVGEQKQFLTPQLDLHDFTDVV